MVLIYLFPGGKPDEKASDRSSTESGEKMENSESSSGDTEEEEVNGKTSDSSPTTDNSQFVVFI